MSTDWGDGAYEAFSGELAPAAARLVEIAAVRADDEVVDLGCGDGNATVLLAATGALVTAVDPSARLLDLAGDRCAVAGWSVAGAVGTGESLPLANQSADVIVSNFGVIFSADPPAAIAEVLRVFRPGGRFVYSAWLPEGGIAAAGQLLRSTMADVSGDASAAQRSPLPWHEPHAWLSELVPGGDASISLQRFTLDFVAESGAAWMADQELQHPMWRAARVAIDDEPRWRELMAASALILDEHSTTVGTMTVSSSYVVVTVRPTP